MGDEWGIERLRSVDDGRGERQSEPLEEPATARGLRCEDDAKEARVFTQGRLPEAIAFDHRKIISDYFKYVKTGKRPN